MVQRYTTDRNRRAHTKGNSPMRTTPTTRSKRAGATLLGIALFASGAFGAACSDDDDTKADAKTGDKTEQETTTTEAADAPEGDVVEVTAVDYAFEGLPEKIEAGTKLTLANDAPAELHELVVMRIPDEETRSVDELVKLPEEEIGKLFGAAPPATVLLAGPNGGEQINAVGDGTISEPGRYAVICSIPTGADAEAFLEAAEGSDGPPQVEGGPPHLAHGMYAELIVE